ncbi:MAG: hypothetical protein IPF92_19425 [Myxococcales bacterium]|jgi:hypothetical protein|nr:hypothetical protein [Myxococcales bacterium]
MRRIGRRPFLLSGLALAACGGSVANTPDASTFDAGAPAPPPTPSSPPSFPPSGLDAAPPPEECGDKNPSAGLAALTGLAQAEPTLPRLYSFTTKAQADGLRRGDPLFSKTTTDSGHRGYLFDVLEARAKTGDSVASLLAGPRFETGRFAWPFLAGTRVSPERYGDEIVAFTFKPDALFVTVSAQQRAYAFYDARGARVPDATALAAPERLAAFLFMNDSMAVMDSVGNPFSCGGTIDVGLVYREFYLGNLGMIAEWSLGTQAIVDRLAAEVSDLRSLARDLDCSKGALGPSCVTVLRKWMRVGTTRADKLIASMAFATPFGRSGLRPADLTRLADDLDKLRFLPSPLVVTP